MKIHNPLKKWVFEHENPEIEAVRGVKFKLIIKFQLNGRGITIKKRVDLLYVYGFKFMDVEIPDFKSKTLNDGDYFMLTLEQTFPQIAQNGKYENYFQFYDNADNLIGCFIANFEIF
ncbi:hypothetical protein ABPG72_016832 [Tetrahymena utriculariae]